MPKTRSFSVEIPVNDPEKMESFQAAMDQYYDELNKHIGSLASELGVSVDCASSVYYLRTRSRWTQELENRLVQMDRNGQKMPNMCEWP